MSAGGFPIGHRGVVLGISVIFWALASLFTAAPAEGQSLIAREGLGVPTPPLDARARALGSAGLGLSGWNIGTADPSAPAGLTLPMITVSLQPTQSSVEGGETAGATRFPIVGVSYPYRNNVFSIRLESFLDQEWENLTEETIVLGGQDVVVEDRYASSGGVGQIRFGWARRLVESMAVGASVGTYVGAVERRFSRSTSGEQILPGVEPFEIGGRWRASGFTGEIGANWDPSSLLRVAAAVAWSGDMEFSPAGGNDSGDRRYPIPLEFRGGGTFTLTPGLGLVLGVTYADWTDTGESLSEGGTRGGALTYGGGLEWSQISLRQRPIPVRIGVREAQLPFLVAGESASERTYSAGLGVYLAETESQSLARLELGLERGERSAGTFSETFWRTTLSIRLAGG